MSHSAVSTATQKAQPVRNIQAIIAAAMVVITALGAISWAAHPDWMTIVVTILPAIGIAYATYQAKALPEKVVPFEDTAVYVNEAGDKVAGPASPLKDGTLVSELESTTADAALAALEGQKAKVVGIDPLSSTPSLAPVEEPAPQTAPEQQTPTDTK